MNLTSEAVDAYLHRIGATRPPRPTVEALHDLHRRHVSTVPFENIDFILRRPVAIGVDAYDKIVDQGRGGGCYELNGAFAEILRALGYQVTVLGGQAFLGRRPGPLLGHLVPQVVAEDSDQAWLVDVGFGLSPHQPLRLDRPEPQPDPQGTYLVVRRPDGDIDVHRNGSLVYRLEPRQRDIADFLPMLWWFRMAPDSPFLTELFCSIHTPGGKVVLTGNVLRVVEGGQRSKRVLCDDEEIRDAYRTYFGMELDELPVDPRRPA